MTEQTCDTCRFANLRCRHPDPNKVWCNRYPPSFPATHEDHWPVVAKQRECGEWGAKDPVTKE